MSELLARRRRLDLEEAQTAGVRRQCHQFCCSFLQIVDYPIDTQFVDCDLRSNPISAILERTPRCAPALPDCLWQAELARQSAAFARIAARARQAAKRPPSLLQA